MGFYTLNFSEESDHWEKYSTTYEQKKKNITKHMRKKVNGCYIFLVNLHCLKNNLPLN